MPTLDDLKQRLESERARLESEIHDVSAQPAESRPTVESYYGNHLADVGSETFEGEKSVALEAHLTGLLNQVNDALSRFAEGTYGRCEQCGQPIAPERLDALPYATRCITCSQTASRAERRA